MSESRRRLLARQIMAKRGKWYSFNTFYFPSEKDKEDFEKWFVGDLGSRGYKIRFELMIGNPSTYTSAVFVPEEFILGDGPATSEVEDQVTVAGMDRFYL